MKTAQTKVTKKATDYKEINYAMRRLRGAAANVGNLKRDAKALGFHPNSETALAGAATLLFSVINREVVARYPEAQELLRQPLRTASATLPVVIVFKHKKYKMLAVRNSLIYTVTTKSLKGINKFLKESADFYTVLNPEFSNRKVTPKV